MSPIPSQKTLNKTRRFPLPVFYGSLQQFFTTHFTPHSKPAFSFLYLSKLHQGEVHTLRGHRISLKRCFPKLARRPRQPPWPTILCCQKKPCTRKDLGQKALHCEMCTCEMCVCVCDSHTASEHEKEGDKFLHNFFSCHSWKASDI